MTNRQEHRLSMYLTFKDFQQPYTEITETLPNYTSNISLFTDTIAQIQAVSEKQRISKKGVTDNKQQLKESLIVATADYARKLTAYAKFSNDLVLVQEVRFSEGRLRIVADTAVRDYAQIAYDRAQSHLTNLEDYGITEETQTTLQDLITSYNAALGKPGVSRVEGGKNTMELKTLFETAETVLNHIDTAVEIVRVSEASFYTAYKNARKVVGKNGTTMAVRGLVTDASNGMPMKGVNLSFIAGTGDTLLKRTAEKGRFSIKNLASGMYTVIVQKMGYADQSTTIAVADGELTVLNFQLSKN